MNPNSRVLFLVVFLVVGIISGCDVCPTSRPSGFTNHPYFQLVDRPGSFAVKANCLDGEQLLGGGFAFDDPRFPVDRNGNFIKDRDGNVGGHEIVVTASYPLDDKKTWEVDFINPDLGPNGPNIGGVFRADAYCLRTNVADLGMAMQMQAEPTPLNNVVNRLTVAAPQGTVVTDGGYRMEYQAGDPFPDYNGYATTSAPVIRDAKASGWQVGKMPSLTGHPAKMNAYVLFATKNITAATTLRVPATTNGLGFGTYAATPQCADDEFAAGGGFEIIGAPDQAYYIPHWVKENAMFPDASGWRLNATYGFQSMTANPMSGLDAPTTANVYATAVCLKSPKPNICVKITAPPDGTIVDLESIEPATKTKALTFTAEAYNGKTQLPPSSLSWTVSGAVVGTGSPATFSIPLPSPVVAYQQYYQPFKVIVTATDGTSTASVSITVYAQKIVIL